MTQGDMNKSTRSRFLRPRLRCAAERGRGVNSGLVPAAWVAVDVAMTPPRVR
jgi:hypothetical protein